MQTKRKNITVSFDGTEYLVQIVETDTDTLEVTVNGIKHFVSLNITSSEIPTLSESLISSIPKTDQAPQVISSSIPASPAASDNNLVSAPMPGDIIEISVKVGDQISIGQKLLVLEAMKMKNVIRSPQSGKVAAIEVASGQSVKYGDPLIRFG